MKFTCAALFVFSQGLLSCALSSSIDVDSICGPETNDDLVDSIQSARRVASDWLLGKRERHFGWRQGNTAAAVTSLQLTNESFSRENESTVLERELTIKQLHIEILSLLSKAERSHSSNSFHLGRHHRSTIDRLPYYIMALNATCQDSTDFHGIDLLSRLTEDMKRFREDRAKQYYQHALGVLAMCSTGHPVKKRYIEDLLQGQQSDGCYQKPCAASACNSSIGIDTTSMVLSALSCVHRTDLHHDEEIVETGIERAVDCLLQSHQNGSFGNAVNDAMAAQALLSAEVNHSRWDCHATLGSVLGAMHEDGHYGSLAGTIQVLPLLAGRHHRHLKELEPECPEEYSHDPVPDLEYFPSFDAIPVRILLKVSTDAGDMHYQLEGPQGESLLELMHRKQETSSIFTFETKTTDWGEYVTSINGVEEEAGSGLHWVIGRLEGPDEVQCLDKGAADIYPEHYEHYVWTHRSCATVNDGQAPEEGNENTGANEQLLI